MNKKVIKKEKLHFTVNEFGELVLSKSYEEINSRLDRRLYDKKNKVPVRNKK